MLYQKTKKPFDPSLSWIGIGTPVYVYQGSDNVPGHRAHPYHGTITQIRKGNTFKVRSAFNYCRVEHAKSLYKSEADAPIFKANSTCSHEAKRKLNAMKQEAAQSAKKMAKVTSKLQEERAHHKRELEKEKVMREASSCSKGCGGRS